jgi:hypothetical protein
MTLSNLESEKSAPAREADEDGSSWNVTPPATE